MYKRSMTIPVRLSIILANRYSVRMWRFSYIDEIDNALNFMTVSGSELRRSTPPKPGVPALSGSLGDQFRLRDLNAGKRGINFGRITITGLGKSRLRSI